MLPLRDTPPPVSSISPSQLLAQWSPDPEPISLPLLLTHIFPHVSGERRLSLPSPGEQQGLGQNLSYNSVQPTPGSILEQSAALGGLLVAGVLHTCGLREFPASLAMLLPPPWSTNKRRVFLSRDSEGHSR